MTCPHCASEYSDAPAVASCCEWRHIQWERGERFIQRLPPGTIVISIKDYEASVRAEELRDQARAQAESWRQERDEARAEVERLKAWADKFEADTRDTPVNLEDLPKGASVYNWRIWFVRQIRAVLAEGGE